MAGVEDVKNHPVDQVLYRPVRPADASQTGRSAEKAAPSFDDLLRRQLDKDAGIKFSAHAQKRLAESHIAFGAERVARLEEAVARAAGKGARESLILMRDLALVVSIGNRTVITAIDGERLQQNVFTTSTAQ